jgi:hypothetical protein
MNPSDGWRAGALIGAAALQIAAGAAAGAGWWGEQVGVVANSRPTLLLPGEGAFGIWLLIYIGFAALAIRQALPSQRSRAVYKHTGWWLVASGVLNAAWVALFSHRLVTLAQVVIVGMLVCLGIVAMRLLQAPAEGWPDRLLLHTPVAVYVGWVAVATVAGGATTTAFLGAAPTADAAVMIVLLTGLAAAIAMRRLPAVAGFAGSVCWALIWIAIATPAGSVRVAAITAVVAVAIAATLRLLQTGSRAFG